MIEYVVVSEKRRHNLLIPKHITQIPSFTPFPYKWLSNAAADIKFTIFVQFYF